MKVSIYLYLLCVFFISVEMEFGKNYGYGKSSRIVES